MAAIVNIFNLASLGTVESQSANSVNELSVDITSANSESSDVFGNSDCEKVDNRFVGKFVSQNVVNLSSKILTKAEISLLSKGLKLALTPNSVKATLKEELEIFGRRLRLLWHFRNEEQTSTFNPFFCSRLQHYECQLPP